MGEARHARHDRRDLVEVRSDAALVGAAALVTGLLGYAAGQNAGDAGSLSAAGPETVLVVVVLVVLVTSVLWHLGRAQTGRQEASVQRLTRSLVEALDSAQEQERRRAQLTHDARNACAGVRASLEILADHAPELDEDSAARLRELALFGLVHLEEVIARSNPYARDFGATEIVHRVAEGRRLLGADIAILGDDVWANGRPHDFATVLLNMLVNAEVHAPGTPVTIDVGSRDGHVRVCVSDGGPGIPPEHAEAAFDRGWRGADSAGQGLGLHTARALMRDQGGDITLVPGTRGASFAVSLPLAERRGSGRPEAAPTSAAGSSTGTAR